MTQFAVLTGDIVQSSNSTPAELAQMMAALERASAEISGWASTLATGFARRGGDGWQLALDRPRLAFRAALYCQAVIRRMGDGCATRIAVADGEGTLPQNDPNQGYGAAFTRSGRALDAMDRYTHLVHAAGGAEAAAYRLAGSLTESWTAAQARAVAEMLPPNTATQAQAATKLGITRTAVQQALAAADYRALMVAVRHMEDWA